jgi:hypothetical protein
LEYSAEKDAVFCYACRRFPAKTSKEKSFTVTGFRNWKRAVGDCNKGLLLHNSSHPHLNAMTMWMEFKLRTSQNLSVSTLVNETVLEKHRYYVKSIAECIIFLVCNELPLRGDFDKEEMCERGLFQRLFQYTLTKDTKLSEISQTIPKNATYLSGQMQNDVIEILNQLVMENVASDIKSADVPW